MAYVAPLWYEHLSDLINELRDDGQTFIADKVQDAAYHDQHDQYHDGEFHDGCTHCDKEREEYG